MPNYTKSDRDYVLSNEEIKSMLKAAPDLQARAWISTLWLTAARPAEGLLLKKIDVVILKDKTAFKLKTLKHKDTHKFVPHHRNLVITIDSDTIFISPINSLLKKKRDPESKLFLFSLKTGYNKINNAAHDALGRSVCPYNLRHSRMTLLAEDGASEEMLKRFKGSITAASVRSYLHVRKVDYTVEI